MVSQSNGDGGDLIQSPTTIENNGSDGVTSLSTLAEATSAILTGIEAMAGDILARKAEMAGRAEILALMAETQRCSLNAVQLFSELQLGFQRAAKVGKLLDEILLCFEDHHSHSRWNVLSFLIRWFKGDKAAAAAAEAKLSSLMQGFKDEAAKSCNLLAKFASKFEKIAEQQKDTKGKVDQRHSRATNLIWWAEVGKILAGVFSKVHATAALDAVTVVGTDFSGLGSFLSNKCDKVKEVYEKEVEVISAALSSESENLNRIAYAVSDLKRTIESAADGFRQRVETASTADREGRQAVVQEAKRLRARLVAYEVFAGNLREQCHNARVSVTAALREVAPQQNYADGASTSTS